MLDFENIRWGWQVYITDSDKIKIIILSTGKFARRVVGVRGSSWAREEAMATIALSP